MLRRIMSKRAVIALLAVLVFSWFAVAVVFESVHQPLVYDDAYNASVARNFSMGMGWVTDYHVRVPFNSTVTSGPTLLLPAAALMKVFGPQLWIPGLINACLMLSLLLIGGVTLRRLIDSDLQFLAIVVLCVVFLAIYDTRVWSEFVGDGVIPLAIAVAAALIVGSLQSIERYRCAAAAGALLALAALSKLYALIAIMGLIFSCLALYIRGISVQEIQVPAAIKSYGVAMVAAAAFIVPWKIYASLSLGAFSAAEILAREEFSASFFQRYGSGIDGLIGADNIFVHMWSNAERNFSRLVPSLQINEWWGSWFAFALLSLPFVVGLILLLHHSRRGISQLLLLLSGAAAAHWFWFIFISTGAPRYSRVAMVLSCILVALLLSLKYQKVLLPLALATLVLLLPAAQKSQLVDLLFLNAPAAQSLKQQENFITAVSSLQGDTPVAGCDWAVSRVLDYAAPAASPLKDAVLLLRHALREEGYSKAHGRGEVSTMALKQEIKFAHPVNFRLAINMGEWAYHKKLGTCPIAAYLDSVCDRVVFSEGLYAIKECSVGSIPAATAAIVSDSPSIHLSGSAAE
ncbi:hypothetical protein [Aquipseudomonas alcaligenes]|uniref:hypothetical protein n=1 Tax=Aquipseudomonas alcaligenes TaxID=43263 RepID=UPI00364A22A8